jgi:2'-5' RNA ligase
VDTPAVPVPEGAAPGVPFSAVVIPVREAEPIVRHRSFQVWPGLLSRDGVAAHITLLAPFHPPSRIDDAVIRYLAGFFAEVMPFGYELTEVCEFPSGITYLAPEPAAPFRRLTQDLHHAFPEFPPYGGAFDEVVPHLTVPLPPGEDTESLRTSLQRTLPLVAHAVEAVLVHVEEGDTHVIATLPFGISAA